MSKRVKGSPGITNIVNRMFPDKRKIAFEEYLRIKKNLEAMSSEELDFEYGRTVAAYDNKKGAWGLLWGTAIASILVGVWSAFFKVIQAFLQYAGANATADPIEAATVGFAIISPVVIAITAFVLILFRDSMKEARKLKEKIQLIETIKGKRSETVKQ